MRTETRLGSPCRRRITGMRIAVCLCLAACLPAQQGPDRAVCTTAGAVFGTDILANRLLVKDATDRLQSLRLAPTTKLVRLRITSMSSDKSSHISVQDVQAGDLVCAVAEGSDTPILQISVVSRADVERAQQQFVGNWAKDSVFGRILSIDSSAREMTVTPTIATLSPAAVTVRLAADTRCRSFPKAATEVAEGQTIAVTDLRVGDTVYVHGSRRAAGDSALLGGIVITGGARGIIGVFESAHPLDSTVIIHEYGTGKRLTMRVPKAQLYRTSSQLNSPYRIPGPEGVALAPIGPSDLRAGDVVLILGTADEASSDGNGLLLITRFGFFGAVPGGENRLSWFLK
jgi:hypothetical protein